MVDDATYSKIRYVDVNISKTLAIRSNIFQTTAKPGSLGTSAGSVRTLSSTALVVKT
jgi:hypothetical protein